MSVTRFPIYLSPLLQNQCDTIALASQCVHSGNMTTKEALKVAKLTLSNYTKNNDIHSILTNFTVQVLGIDPKFVEFTQPIDKGSSEEQVYIVKSIRKNRSIAVFKIFKENSKNFLPEVFSLQFLCDTKIADFYSPRINVMGKYKLKKNNYFLICESVAPGKSLMTYYKSNQFDILERGVRKCGLTLAKLHQYFPAIRRGISSSLEEESQEKLTKAIEKLTLFPQNGIDVKKLQVLFDRRLKIVKGDTLSIGFTHGDPTLENVFFEPTTGTITWIDPPTFADSVSSIQQPDGIVARDFHLFISDIKSKQVNHSLNHKNEVCAHTYLPDKKVSSLINTFYSGYIGAKRNPPTRSQIDLYSLMSHFSVIDSTTVFDPLCSLPEPLKSAEKHRVVKILEDLELQLEGFRRPAIQDLS